MTTQTEEQVLTSLGLTFSQAKVYLTLVRNGPSGVTLISQISKIHRTHLYEILESLGKMGFVEKKLESAEYMAAPLKEVAPILVKQRQQEISKLETEINTIVDNTPERKSSLEIKHEILMTFNKKRTLNRVQKYFEDATWQIELIQTWKRFLQFWQYYENTLAGAMERSVIIKQIVELPKDESQAKEFLQKKVFQNGLFELRFVCKAGGNYVLVDGRILLLSTTQVNQNLGETPFIFTNYDGLLGLMQEYFQLSWKTGTSNK